MNNKYTTVLFDADNTLLDFDKAENEALKSVMAIYNLTATEENCRKYSEINDALWKQFEKGEIFLNFSVLRKALTHFRLTRLISVFSEKAVILLRVLRSFARVSEKRDILFIL